MRQTDEAYYELELAEADAPVGLVVVELPSFRSMTNDYEAHGSGFALPNWERTADDDERQKWFFDPPGDGIPLSLAIRYGQHTNLSTLLDEYGYPSFCLANEEDDRQGLLLDSYLTGADRSHLYERQYHFPCFLTPTSTEFGTKEYTDGSDSTLSQERWWGHTGGHKGHGAVVSVSNVSCGSESVDCSVEPGDLGSEEHICEVTVYHLRAAGTRSFVNCNLDLCLCAQVITRPNSCDFTKYRSKWNQVHNCPYEVDCGGVRGKFVRVRLPGANRILSYASIDVYRDGPAGIPAETSAEDNKRGYACYGVETQLAPDANSETFLEDVKQLHYTIRSPFPIFSFFSMHTACQPLGSLVPKKLRNHEKSLMHSLLPCCRTATIPWTRFSTQLASSGV